MGGFIVYGPLSSWGALPNPTMRPSASLPNWHLKHMVFEREESDGRTEGLKS